MQEAIEAYRSITASPEFREAERLRSKARHDEAQALYNAKLEGIRETETKWQDTVAETDRKWHNVVAERDAIISDKDAMVIRLRRFLSVAP